MVICGASISTAFTASMILSSIMIFVILLSQKFSINPDNVATPIAASLGDLTTVSILAVLSSYFYSCAQNNQQWIIQLVIGSGLLLTPLFLYLAFQNTFTREVVFNGWTPIICAMGISSFGGVILDLSIAKFSTIAVFQPLMNGVGGNLVAILASRLSTSLHMLSSYG